MWWVSAHLQWVHEAHCWQSHRFMWCVQAGYYGSMSPDTVSRFMLLKSLGEFDSSSHPNGQSVRQLYKQVSHGVRWPLCMVSSSW